MLGTLSKMETNRSKNWMHGLCKKMFQGLTVGSIILATACKESHPPVDLYQVKQSVHAVENAFEEMLQKEGIRKAFVYYAAEDAVLSRGNHLIRGRSAIDSFYAKYDQQKISLQWEPESIHCSPDGRMAYTYGPYYFSKTDTVSGTVYDTGFFHTVWSKQDDGQWRFVWD